jgi:hypothetical protein
MAVVAILFENRLDAGSKGGVVIDCQGGVHRGKKQQHQAEGARWAESLPRFVLAHDHLITDLTFGAEGVPASCNRLATFCKTLSSILAAPCFTGFVLSG